MPKLLLSIEADTKNIIIKVIFSIAPEINYYILFLYKLTLK